MKGFAFFRQNYMACLSTTAAFFLFSAGAVLASSGESGGVQVIPDESLILQIVNFVFLIWVLNMLLYRPIRKILRQRKDKIQGLELTISTFEEDCREKDEALAAGIKAAREKGLREKETVLLAAQEEEKAIIERVNQKAHAELTGVREKIRQDAEAVRASLQGRVEEFAADISRKILGRAV